MGRTPDHYAIFVGGDFVGTRLNSKILDKVPYDKLPDLFDVLFGQYASNRQEQESYGDFVMRIGLLSINELIKENFSNEKWAA